MFKLRIILLASGAGTLAQAIIDAKLDLEILALISDKPSPALERAKIAGIKNIFLPFKESREIWDQKLLDVVWGLDFETSTNVVDTYISYLRKKLHKDGFEGIKTVRGVGFRLDLK